MKLTLSSSIDNLVHEIVHLFASQLNAVFKYLSWARVRLNSTLPYSYSTVHNEKKRKILGQEQKLYKMVQKAMNNVHLDMVEF